MEEPSRADAPASHAAPSLPFCTGHSTSHAAPSRPPAPSEPPSETCAKPPLGLSALSSAMEPQALSAPSLQARSSRAAEEEEEEEKSEGSSDQLAHGEVIDDRRLVERSRDSPATGESTPSERIRSGSLVLQAAHARNTLLMSVDDIDSDSTASESGRSKSASSLSRPSVVSPDAAVSQLAVRTASEHAPSSHCSSSRRSRNQSPPTAETIADLESSKSRDRRSCTTSNRNVFKPIPAAVDEGHSSKRVPSSLSSATGTFKPRSVPLWPTPDGKDRRGFHDGYDPRLSRRNASDPLTLAEHELEEKLTLLVMSMLANEALKGR